MRESTWDEISLRRWVQITGSLPPESLKHFSCPAACVEYVRICKFFDESSFEDFQAKRQDMFFLPEEFDIEIEENSFRPEETDIEIQNDFLVALTQTIEQRAEELWDVMGYPPLYVETIGHVSEETVKRYIEDQKSQ